MRPVILWTCVGLAAAGLTSATLAKPKPAPTNAAVVQRVVDCRKIEDGAQRLACYDAAVEALNTAQATGDLVTIDRQQRQAVRKQAFGFALPSLDVFDRGEGQLQSVEETLASASEDYTGRWTFVMEDGQVWRQIDSSDELTRRPHPGDTVTIRRAALGSFFLSVGSQPGVKAHRDQ